MLNDKKLQSNEGTTQGNPAAMAVYGIALTPLQNDLATCYPESDPDGRFANPLGQWREIIEMTQLVMVKNPLGCSLKYGYFPNQTKKYLLLNLKTSQKL